MRTVIHLRDQYLGVSFIYFLLKGFRKFRHEVFCREILQADLNRYPYESISKTSSLFNLTWLLDKFFTVKLGLVARPINDWYAYYFRLRNRRDILVLHAHMGPQGYYAIQLAKKINRPLFVTFYGSDMSDIPKLPGWMERYSELFNLATLIIVEGTHMKSKMVELGCPDHKIEVVKIGVPLDHLPFQYRPVLSSQHPWQILMCANFFPKKGYLTALKAIRLMKEQGEKVVVTIIGSGPLDSEIRGFIADNHLSDIVVLIGKKTLPEIYELSKQMHVFFHPSETAPDGGSEGGAPTIIIEMQALGLPIISTLHADIPNIIPEENHFLASEYDPQSLVQMFNKLKKEKDWNLISDRGRGFVLDQHSNVRCSSKMEELYQEYA